MSPKAKYIYVGRDGRNTAWSLHNHYNATDAYFEKFNSSVEHLPAFTRGTDDTHAFFQDWLARDGYPMWPLWDHNPTWWTNRSMPNVKFIHYNDLKSDLPGAIRSIAEFLILKLPEDRLDLIASHRTFSYMKANAARIATRGGASSENGGLTFINKGQNGRWRDTLSPAEIAAYDAKAIDELGSDCALWLEHGSRL